MPLAESLITLSAAAIVATLTTVDVLVSCVMTAATLADSARAHARELFCKVDGLRYVRIPVNLC
ncbi:hypothetical protein [Paraburkholderia silvatlantica]|uniref:hypothetical protein n=1 Tax=Paraburkholderia silvatlantica TaxID=321895 RepID=UPI003751D007